MAECPWNGCNRIRGIEFPKLDRIDKGFYTGDTAQNRKINVEFEPSYLINYRVILGTFVFAFIKTANMTVWESVSSDTGTRLANSIKFLSDGFEINNGGLYFEVNRLDYGYDWFAYK